MNAKKDPNVKGLIDKWSSVFAQNTHAEYVFNKDGDFEAINAAEAYAREKGYSCGSIDGTNPVGVARGECYVGKWHTMLHEHHRNLSGVILSNDFRHGPCVFVEYRRGIL